MGGCCDGYCSRLELACCFVTGRWVKGVRGNEQAALSILSSNLAAQDVGIFPMEKPFIQLRSLLHMRPWMIFMLPSMNSSHRTALGVVMKMTTMGDDSIAADPERISRHPVTPSPCHPVKTARNAREAYFT